MPTTIFKSAIGAAALLFSVHALCADAESQRLMDQADKLNDQCRDSPNAQDKCDQRDALMTKLEQLGWCWGSYNQIGADRKWERCEPLPRFDVRRSCEKIANSNGQTSQMILSGCLRNEQSSYNDLKVHWEKIPHPMTSSCIEIAESDGFPTYQILHGCIVNELNSGATNKSFEFKY